jgi:hypothetical protein
MTGWLIPERYRPGIQKLISSDQADLDLLIKVLQKQTPTLNTEDLAAEIAKKVQNFNSDDIKDIIESLVALYSFRSLNRLSEQEVIENIVDLHQSNAKILGVSENNRKYTEDLLKLFLNIGGVLDIASKAVSVMLSHENLFISSHVLTDIRPVFETKVIEKPACAVIIHTIKFEYRNDGEIKEVFFAMDVNDIGQLREQLDRADQKADALIRMLEKSEVHYLKVE